MWEDKLQALVMLMGCISLSFGGEQWQFSPNKPWRELPKRDKDSPFPINYSYMLPAINGSHDFIGYA